MRLIDADLLARFRLPGRCEYCRVPCPSGLDPHHIMTKGAGRVDASFNLVALCRKCHTGFHTSGKPSRDDLLAIAGEREGVSPSWIEYEVWRIRRDQSQKVKVVS